MKNENRKYTMKPNYFFQPLIMNTALILTLPFLEYTVSAFLT